jgi:hypothetical protein
MPNSRQLEPTHWDSSEVDFVWHPPPGLLSAVGDHDRHAPCHSCSPQPQLPWRTNAISETRGVLPNPPEWNSVRRHRPSARAPAQTRGQSERQSSCHARHPAGTPPTPRNVPCLDTREAARTPSALPDVLGDRTQCPSRDLGSVPPNEAQEGHSCALRCEKGHSGTRRLGREGGRSERASPGPHGETAGSSAARRVVYLSSCGLLTCAAETLQRNH